MGNFIEQSLRIALFLVAGLSLPILFADKQTNTSKEKDTAPAETVVLPSLDEIVKKKVYKHFVTQQLFSNPMEKGCFWGKFAKWPVPTITAIVWLVGNIPNFDTIYHKDNYYRYKIDDAWAAIFASAFFAGIIGLEAYSIVDRDWSKKLNFKANSKDAFMTFLNNWPNLKKRTPPALHSLFDDLYEKITKDEFPKEALREAVPRFFEVVESLLDETLKPEETAETAKP